MKNQNGCNTSVSKVQGANLVTICGRRLKTSPQLACLFIVVMILGPAVLAQNAESPQTGTTPRPGSGRGRAARAAARPQANPQPTECVGAVTSLVPIPEITHSNGTLQAVVISADQSRTLWPPSGSPPCNAQTMRYYWGYPQSQGSGWWTIWLAQHSIGAQEPIPGPTLRARVGDLVEIMFLNQINPQDFSNSQDLAHCDISSNGYPGSDTYPDCIHSSTTTNIHFHGTHTTPSTTGDNVLMQVLPNPAGAVPATPPISDFFKWCTSNGTPSNWLQPYPSNWFGSFEQLQMGNLNTPESGLIGNYDYNAKFSPPFSLWQSNNNVIRANGWPQYYYGAFPYCFRLPDYNQGGVKMGQSPGTHWYHAHQHGSTNINVSNGMTGALIIEGGYDDWLNNFYGQTNQQNNLQQQVLVIQQLSVASNLKKIVVPPNFPGPAALSVNGRLSPAITMQAGQVQMWRIVNSATRDMVTLYPPAGISWQQIAQDGVQLAAQNIQTSQPVTLAAGNRADLLVQVPPNSPANIVFNACATMVAPAPTVASCQANGALINLLSVNVKGATNSPMALLPLNTAAPLPAFLNDIPASEVHLRREVVFNSVINPNATPPPVARTAPPANSHFINNRQFSDHRVDQAMLLDTVEEWKVINLTAFAAGPNPWHPFHIHVNPFQVIGVFDPSAVTNWTNPSAPCYVNPLDPETWKQCNPPTANFVWWDTFAIPVAVTQFPGPLTLPPAFQQYQQYVNCTTTSPSTCTITVPSTDLPPAVQPYAQCTNATPSTCTILVAGHFRMRTRFSDFTGQYVLHCHILAHEDRGMMELVEVVPNTTMLHH